MLEVIEVIEDRLSVRDWVKLYFKVGIGVNSNKYNQ